MPSDDKDFFWLCNLLALTHAQVPTIETIFLHKDEVTLWVRCGNSGKVKKHSVQDLPERASATVLSHFMEICDTETPGCEAICFLMVKGVRVLIDWERMEDTATVHNLLLRSSMVQGIMEEKENPPIYLLRLDLRDREYVSDFQVKRSGVIDEGRNTRIWCKALSLTKVVLGMIERMKRRTVDSVELEFIVSESGDVFLYGCPSLKLHSSLQREATSQMDFHDLHKHASQFRFSTPPSLRRQDNAIEKPLEVLENAHEANNSRLGSARGQNSPQGGFLPHIRKSVQLPHAFSNPNFRELLALNYAKSNPYLPKEDLETVFQTMDEAILREEEIRPRMASPPIASRKQSRILEDVHKISVAPLSCSTPRKIPQHKPALSLASISEKMLARKRLDPIMLMRRRAEVRKGSRTSRLAH